MKRLKILCCLLSICILFSVFLSGCSECESRPDKTNKKDFENRMSSVYGNMDSFNKIIVDKETGVMYIAVYKGGICVMVDENGKPLKYNRK